MVRWDAEKSGRLKRERGVSFEELMQAEIVAKYVHPNRHNQEIMRVLFKGYIWAIPCVVKGGETFLKTAFPSRKYLKKFLRGELV